ncbi:LysR family transcriptional regulator [Saccharomonospora piscinae]|uniref:LysR family transcriptional regulator n=1 Tax=Saccharomonospora piscinae TaxID=687388 RepID=A0A1V9A6G4_SACPI|nr:LysR family transcriptional regulator [Saccharomonospora piscinae]OQO92650.1 LysR family transcriptional regulator [Saccharomonospora piscinae]
MATLRQWEYLVAIVDEGSFTRAAEALHVTQPGLSHQVRTLERALGGPLLERLPRSVRPTPLGRAVLPHARAALADAHRALCAARRTAGLEAGELDVATVYSVGLGVLPDVLRFWRKAHPAVRIRLHEHRHADHLREAMLAGQADLAVGPTPGDWDGPVHVLGEEEFVVVAQPDDPLATVRSVELAALADRQWVHYSPGNGLAEVVDTACAAAGFRPRAAVRTEQTAAAPVFAASGLGVALVPGNILSPAFDGVVVRPSPAVTRALAAYTRHDPDPLTSAFLRALEGCCRGLFTDS